MESKGEINIAPNYSKESYLNLKLSMQSSAADWHEAITILRDRIEGRYFNQIDLLLGDINSNGFTIMALNCLLIEALFQFRDGKKTTPRPNSETYPMFLLEEFPLAFDLREKADKFYSDIRCGILHSAQTQNGSRLSDEQGFVVRLDSSSVVVSVLELTLALRAYFDVYTQRLANPAEITLRQNFIKKMKYVCRGRV